jgi:hypothetical protein
LARWLRDQPEPVRKDWAPRCGNTWNKLAYPGRIVHYAELRKLLIEHASHLASRIDRGNMAESPGD